MEDELYNFKEFMFKTNKFRKAMVKRVPAEYEDLQQDFMLIYFSYPEIEELFLKGEVQQAWNIFRNHLRLEVKKYMIIPARLESKKEENKYKAKVDDLFYVKTLDELGTLPARKVPKKKLEDRD